MVQIAFISSLNYILVIKLSGKPNHFINCLLYISFATRMTVKRKSSRLLQSISSVFLILALLWLTVSTPFVFETQQKLIKAETKSTANSSNCDEDAANPFANTTEEKAPTSISSISEYLYEAETLSHPQRCGIPVCLFQARPHRG